MKNAEMGGLARPADELERLSGAVARVLRSPLFERTHRLSELLEYLHRATVAGDGPALKEAAIGVAVFGRPSDYSAGDDNIVRSNIRQLRMRLDEYYQGDGAVEEWRVVVPRGSYALRVEPRPVAALPLPPEPGVTRRNWAGFALGGLVGAMLAGAAFWGVERRAAPPKPEPSLLSLLAPAPGQKVMVIGPDSGAQHYRTFTGSALALDEFLSRRYLEPEELKRRAPGLNPQVSGLFRGGMLELFVAAMLPGFAQVIPPEDLTVPVPAKVKMTDFARDNALLISGPFGNPWVQLFDRELNFQVEADEADRRLAHMTNRRPEQGEAASYYNSMDSTHAVVCYARLAYLPGRSARTRVILAGGPHSASTQAASQFLSRPEFLKALRAKLPQGGGGLPYFEALVEARAVESEPWTARIVAIRVVGAAPQPL